MKPLGGTISDPLRFLESNRQEQTLTRSGKKRETSNVAGGDAMRCGDFGRHLDCFFRHEPDLPYDSDVLPPGLQHEVKTCIRTLV